MCYCLLVVPPSRHREVTGVVVTVDMCVRRLFTHFVTVCSVAVEVVTTG